MRICSVCDEEVTPRMIRHGSALSRGGEFLHRECHRSPDRGASAERARATSLRPMSPVVAAATAPAPSERVAVEYASFGRRLAAHLIDSLILTVALVAVSIPLGVAAVLQGASPGLGSLIGSLLGTFLPVAYCVGYWSRKGATPGKTALGIRVVDSADATPSGTQSVVRYLGYILSSLPLCLGYAWMLWDREKRCWHDILSGTRVIRA